MKKRKAILALILFVLGAIGVLSILTMEINLPPEAEVLLSEKFTPQQIKLLILINPTILLLISVIIGTILYQKVGLSVPLIEKAMGLKKDDVDIPGILKFGIVGGILAGVLLSLVSLIFTPLLPTEFLELGESVNPSLATRFLYGGLTEEILMRFGLMTLIVWIVSKISRGTKPIVYWVGIILSAVIFALGHFPIAYQTLGDPSTGLLSYILLGNTIGGLIFGWLYWKKGLESAFLAHIFTHVIMVLAEPLLH